MPCNFQINRELAKKFGLWNTIMCNQIGSYYHKIYRNGYRFFLSLYQSDTYLYGTVLLWQDKNKYVVLGTYIFENFDEFRMAIRLILPNFYLNIEFRKKYKIGKQYRKEAYVREYGKKQEVILEDIYEEKPKAETKINWF